MKFNTKDTIISLILISQFGGIPLPWKMPLFVLG